MRRLLMVAALAAGCWVPAPAWADNQPCKGDRSCEGNQGDCRQVGDGGYCSDDDQLVVVICAQPDSCRFGEGERPPAS